MTAFVNLTCDEQLITAVSRIVRSAKGQAAVLGSKNSKNRESKAYRWSVTRHRQGDQLPLYSSASAQGAALGPPAAALAAAAAAATASASPAAIRSRKACQSVRWEESLSARPAVQNCLGQS